MLRAEPRRALGGHALLESTLACDRLARSWPHPHSPPHIHHARLLALGEDKQQPLVRVELSVVALAHAAQLRQVLRPLLAEQVRLAGVVTQKLARRSHLEALRSGTR